jgi:hypothetical protein
MMMKKVWLASLLGVVLAGMAGSASADQSIGVGGNYWRTIGELRSNPRFDRDGLSSYVSYQYRTASVFFLEAQVERLPEGFMAYSKPVYAPQAFVGAKVLIVYGAVGIGGYYSDGDWADKMFYALRAGVDLMLVPFVHLDINANYQFNNMDEVNGDTTDINTDAVRLGAAVRLVF